MDEMKEKCFANGRIIDVEKGCLRPETEIWVEDGRITRLSRGQAPQDAVDLRGSVVMPGLFNVHTHIQFDSTPAGAVIYASQPRFTVSAVKNLRKYLDSGVTYIRDMGGADYVDLELRNMVREGLVPGPEMAASGKNLSATGGQSWQNGVEVDGKDACIRAVREQCKKDADWIKLMASGGSKTPRTSRYAPQFSLEEMQTVVEEANRLERGVAAHAMGGESARFAAMAGVTSIEHGYFLEEETLDLMAEKGIYYVPTLAISYFLRNNRGKQGVTEEMADKAERDLEVQRRSLLAARERGVVLCVGTDACSPYNDHDGTGHELAAMCECGLTAAEALRAATVNSAKLCGVFAERGSIAPGKRADFALFAENPLEDIAAITRCAAVIQNGKFAKNFASAGENPQKND